MESLLTNRVFSQKNLAEKKPVAFCSAYVLSSICVLSFTKHKPTLFHFYMGNTTRSYTSFITNGHTDKIPRIFPANVENDEYRERFETIK